MGQRKGQTGNPNGRPKGRPNKVTSDTKIWISQLIDSNKKQLERDLKKLEPKDRWMIVEKLMQYTIPKMQNIEPTIYFDNLSDEQLDILIAKICNGKKL